MAKTINTRIQLKYDTLSNWQTNNPALLAGEIAIATLGNSHTTTTPDNGTHPVVFKVGPGAYNDLPFTSALAADVYAWAKQDKLTISKVGTGNVVAGIEWDATANEGKGGIKFTTASVATAEGFEELQEAVNAINEELETYGDIVTHNVSEFATAEQGTKADNAAVKSEVDAALLLKADKSVVDAMYSNSKIDELVAGAKSGAEATAAGALAAARTEITSEISTAIAPLATTEALNGVKTTAEQGVSDAKAAQDKADEVGEKLDTFLGGVTPDGSAEIIDTLAEINSFMTEDTGAFVQLSSRVTTAEGDIDTLEGKVSTLEGLIGENGKVENANTAAVANDLSAALDEEIAGLIATAKSGAEATAAADATSKANKAKDEAIAATSASINGMSIAGEDFTIKNGSKITITPIEDSNSEYPGFTIGVDPRDIYTVSFDNNSLYAKTYSDYEAGVSGTEIVTFAEIATTGSIYDVTEGSNVSTGTDAGTEYLIFNCGTATTII